MVMSHKCQETWLSYVSWARFGDQAWGNASGREELVGVDMVRRALDGEIGRLRVGASFHVIEFAVEGVVAWNVRRDENGTPYAEHWPPVAVPPVGAAIPDSRQLRGLIDAGEQVIFVCSSHEEPPPEVLAFFRKPYPNIGELYCNGGFEEIIRDAIRHSPLTHGYELVLLRRTARGRLVFEPVRLFSQDTSRPATKSLRVRCERSDERGTVFAVVTTEGARHFKLMSVQSADLSPGEYELTAELVRPGRVRFHGLPASAKLGDDHRTWSELVVSVPQRLDVVPPAHLVCAIDVSGTVEQITKRVDRVREVIKLADGSDGRLRVSLFSYGAHSFERTVREDRARRLAWDVTRENALTVLGDLERHSPVRPDYPYAAQLECALALIHTELTVNNGRTVLLVAGGRPPFPPRAARTRILPCPHRNDWRKLAELLRGRQPRVAIGVIYDRDADDPGFWRELGTTSIARADAMDPLLFATDLGLGDASVYVPFPFACTEGD